MILRIPKPVCLTYAANGIARSKRDCLSLPIKTEEVVATAKLVQDAGASVFSFAPRDSKGNYSLDVKEGAALIAALRESVEGSLLLQIELDQASGATLAQFEAYLGKVKPDSCQVSLDQILPRDGDTKEEKAAQSFFKLCDELGVGIQLLLKEPSDVDWFYAFRQYGAIPASCRSVVFVLGKDGEEPQSDPHDLREFLTRMDKQNLLGRIAWSLAAYGPQETGALAAAMALDGHISPGFAYNTHTVDGEEASSPQEQLEALCTIADRLGRPTASAYEARTLLFGPR